MLTVQPEIVERYVRPGKVRLVYRDVLNHGDRSVRTSEAAACAARQGRFWQMHTLLFQRQSDVWGTDSDRLAPLMRRFARDVAGLDQAAFGRCLESRATLKALQAADAEQRARGIRSQPVFEIGNRRLVGTQSIDVFAGALDEALR